MKVLTIKSVETISEELQNEIHYSFGMEHHTDYVFKDKTGSIYATTISLESSDSVIAQIIKQSENFPELSFVVDDLDSESNKIDRYMIKKGEAI